ncbi:MAG: DUF11 domain-containing protein, partial [Anaerolineaceae bacterium]|nr:DUF11 domain-containing protein [Anaerolineaceae bacterium]
MLLNTGTVIAAEPETPMNIEPLTWNVIGLDSNRPSDGPNKYPVGVRACNPASNTATYSDVEAEFVWLSGGTTNDDSIIRLRPGSLDPIQPNPQINLAPGQCTDFYFEVEVARVAAAYDKTRRYRVDVSYDDPNTGLRATASSPTPRELYVEYLVSQNRNATTDVKLNGVSVPVGGSMSLMVGETYTISLVGNTATNGYEQIESFIHFPNTIFQILSVSTLYGADTSANVPNPNSKLYGDSCVWENNPNDPNYRSCLSVGKNGGAVTVTYQIKIISGAGTGGILNTLLYDFSGSSYHYNSDFSASYREYEIIGPSSVTINKRFLPDTIVPGDPSTLMLTVTNPTGIPISGVNFTDPLPANVKVAATPAASTSGCGTPTFVPSAGATSLSFSNGTIGPNSSCTIKVNVTATANGVYNNVTGNLYLGTVDTGNSASATLTAAPAAAACTEGQVLAQWTVPNVTATNPPDKTGGLPTTQGLKVSSAALSANLPSSTVINSTTGYLDTTSWEVYGFKNAGQYIDFVVDTRNYSKITMTYYQRSSGTAGPTQSTLSYDNGSGMTLIRTYTPQTAFTQRSVDFTGLTSTTGTTRFRIAASGANNDNSGAGVFVDQITFTGCMKSDPPPTITKAFAPKPITVGGTSRLTFTVSNSAVGAVSLTGVKFTDQLPSGLVVASPTNATTTCGGSPNWAPAAGSSVLAFGTTTGATLGAGLTCTVGVDVTATGMGQFQNVSGYVSSLQSGENKTASGYASDSLTAVSPPEITKNFAPSTILTNGTTTLSFSLYNPNQSTSLTGVGFTDTLPAGLNVASATSAQCGGTMTATDNAPAADTIVLSGATLAAGSTCSFSVMVTGSTTGDKVNTTGAVTSTQGGNGNTATSSVYVKDPTVSLKLLKQIGLSSDPYAAWGKFLTLTSTPSQVYYKYLIENVGDVALTDLSVSDSDLSIIMGAGGNCVLYQPTLPTPTAFSGPLNPGEYVFCVVGPVDVTSTGTLTNTATASGTYSGTEYDSNGSSAAYGTTGLALAKSAEETSFGGEGDTLAYTYLVTNSGYVPLAGPVTVSDDKTTVACPALSTVGDLDNYLDPADYPAGSGNLAESIECTASYTITADDVSAQSVTNIASASIDGVTSATDEVTVSQAPDLAITIDDGVTSVDAGGTTTYTIVVTNNGPSTVTGAILSNIAVSGLSKTAVVCSGTSECVTAPTVSELESGTFALPELAPGETYQIDVTVDVTATTGSVTNSATIAAPSGVTDSDESNNSASDTDTIDEVADLAITINDGVTSVDAGGTTTYTIVVTNNGPSSVTGAILEVPSATGLSKTAVVCSGTSECVTAPTVSELESGAFALPALAPGETYQIDVTVDVTATSGSVTNSATIDAPSGVTDSDESNNSASDTDTIDEVVDLAITINDGVTNVDAGGTTTYTIVVTNNGPSTVTGAILSDPAVSGLSKTAVVCSGTSECVTAPTVSELESGTFALPALAAGETYQIDVTVNVTATTGSVTKEATIEAPSGVTDSDESNNSASDTDTIDEVADLAITIDDGVTSVDAGGTTTYT